MIWKSTVTNRTAEAYYRLEDIISRVIGMIKIWNQNEILGIKIKRM